MLDLYLLEDHKTLRQALKAGLEAAGAGRVRLAAETGEAFLEAFAQQGVAEPQRSAALLDVALPGALNGIQTGAALRREYPRFPIVFYSIQDDDGYYRDFLHSGILSHYAYVRKSNYLLPESLAPLLRAAAGGSSFIDPEIAARVSEVRHKEANDPLGLLEPNEVQVAALLAQGLTNEQIAARLGYRDARAVSRTNGQIYTAWGLDRTTTDEKVARTRAALIYQRRELVVWDADGTARVQDRDGRWQPLE